MVAKNIFKVQYALKMHGFTETLAHIKLIITVLIESS